MSAAEVALLTPSRRAPQPAVQGAVAAPSYPPAAGRPFSTSSANKRKLGDSMAAAPRSFPLSPAAFNASPGPWNPGAALVQLAPTRRLPLVGAPAVGGALRTPAAAAAAGFRAQMVEEIDTVARASTAEQRRSQLFEDQLVDALTGACTSLALRHLPL